MKKLILPFFVFALSVSHAQTEEDSTLVLNADEMIAFYIDSIESTMRYETGTITLGERVATLEVPEGYKYLNPEQSEYVLTEIWGNPPAESWGLIFRENEGVFGEGYVIDITYDPMGYVEDDDAEDIDYDDLLEEMQKDAVEENKMREQAGYEAIEFVGWAAQPFYDAENKKLHWAKELRFGESEENTLNYAIRVLGRQGVLQLNFISTMTDLPIVQEDLPKILPSVEFSPGYMYSDFDPDFDKVAAVGIGGLIAGKVLAKVGFFALLAKFWKFIAIGAVAAFAFLRKMFGGKKEEEAVAVVTENTSSTDSEITKE
ncbi:MAG: DUF2167 domain-containing protein [Flavobacteriales bacterium]|nr:DUF2167 domain-containing protein [Flavobacteriales bacterium]